MSTKITQWVTLIVSLVGTLGVPAMAPSFLQAHLTFYSVLVGLAIVLHAIFPSIFSAPPSQASVVKGAGTAAVIALLCVTLIAAPITGCSKTTGTTVAQDIVNWTPPLTSAITTIDTTASMLLPVDAPIFVAATAAFDASSALVVQYAKAYLANPSASVLANLQTAITTLQQQASAALLQAVGIKDTNSQKLALAAINGVATIANTLLALVQNISSKAQLAAMQRQVKVHLAEVRPYMDIPALNAAGARYGVNANQFFVAEQQAGF